MYLPILLEIWLVYYEGTLIYLDKSKQLHFTFIDVYLFCQVELPCSPAQLLSAVCDVDVFHCFASLLPHVQLLWELVLIGEPLVVMASQPQTSSDLVQALVRSVCLRFFESYLSAK